MAAAAADTLFGITISMTGDESLYCLALAMLVGAKDSPMSRWGSDTGAHALPLVTQNLAKRTEIQHAGKRIVLHTDGRWYGAPGVISIRIFLQKVSLIRSRCSSLSGLETLIASC